MTIGGVSEALYWGKINWGKLRGPLGESDLIRSPRYALFRYIDFCINCVAHLTSQEPSLISSHLHGSKVHGLSARTLRFWGRLVAPSAVFAENFEHIVLGSPYPRYKRRSVFRFTARTLSSPRPLTTRSSSESHTPWMSKRKYSRLSCRRSQSLILRSSRRSCARLICSLCRRYGSYTSYHSLYELIIRLKT